MQNKIPDTCTKFTRKEYMDVMDILTCIDLNTLIPKDVELQLLTLADSIDSLKRRVIEGIADM